MMPHPPRSIDVIVPTFNRAALLPRVAETFLATKKPDGVATRLVIVDNNSTDDTAAVSTGLQNRYQGVVAVLTAQQQGRHHALNAGIAASRAEVVAFFDDDETLDPEWLRVVAREFTDPDTDFIGGPYVANWLATKPRWLPADFSGVLGISNWGPERRQFGAPGDSARPWGGNSAFRRRVFQEAGPYSGDYMFYEDVELYERILHRFTGYYVPDLVIFHDIPQRKLHKSYFRRWFYENGRNEGRRLRATGGLAPAATVFGVPRWIIRKTVTHSIKAFSCYIAGSASSSFTHELQARWVLGLSSGMAQAGRAVFVDRSGMDGASGRFQA